MRRLSRSLSALVSAFVVALSCLVAAPSAAAAVPSGCVPDPLLCPERLYYGLSVPGLPQDRSGLDAFSARVGRSPSLVMSFQSWAESFDPGYLRSLDAAGQLPMVSWEPYDHRAPAVDRYPLRDTAAGRFDSYLRSQAALVRDAGVPVAIRLAHEMNGNWYPWGIGVNGNVPADYVAMYRHVVDVFEAEGASNVVWVWSPNLIDFYRAPLVSFYPGREYVDWVGLSGYLDDPGERFLPLYRSTLEDLDRFAPTTPIVVSETAVVPSPSRPEQVRDLFAGLLASPRVVGFVWFNQDTRYSWRLESDAVALSAFSSAVSSPWFSSASDRRPVSLPPVSQGVRLDGPARGGALLVASPLWRTTSAAGPVSVSGRWYRCRDAVSTASCVATSATHPHYRLGLPEASRFMRYRAVGVSSAGQTVAWSAPSGRVLVTPLRPGVPRLDAFPGSVRVSFPPVPAGATHWRVRLDGTARPLVAAGTRELWLKGLVDGRVYSWSLEAVSSDGRSSLVSPAVSGMLVSMPRPSAPQVRLHDSRVSFVLPSPPRGASSWRVTLDGRTTSLSAATRTWTVPVVRGSHSWSLVAVGGSAVSLPVSGSFHRP